MRRHIIILIFLLANILTWSQTTDTLKHRQITNDNIYLEVLGNGIIYSLNYEKLIFHRKDYYLTGRIGLGVLFGNTNGVTIPIVFNGLYQLNDNFLIELGTGMTLIYIKYLDNEINPITGQKDSDVYGATLLTSLIGARYQNKNGFMVRTGITPFLSFNHTPSGLWFGISFGYGF